MRISTMTDGESQAQTRHCNGCDKDVLPTDTNVLHEGPFTQEHWRCPNCGWIDQRTAKNARECDIDLQDIDVPDPPMHPTNLRCSIVPIFGEDEWMGRPWKRLSNEEYAAMLVEDARLSAEFEATNHRIRELIRKAMENNNDKRFTGTK